MKLPLPEYFIVGLRPVKIERNAKDEVGVYALDWNTGDFIVAMEYLSRVYIGHSGEVEQVSQDEFDRKVEEIRSTLSKKTSKR